MPRILTPQELQNACPAPEPARLQLTQSVVDLAQERYATHPLFPKGRVRNYCTFTKVDLEERCEVERVPGRSPQRTRRAVGRGPAADGRDRVTGLPSARSPDRPRR